MSKREGGGCSKADRNRPWCQTYRARNVRDRNKALRALRNLSRQNRKGTGVDSELFALFRRMDVLAVRDACRIYESRGGRHYDYTDLCNRRVPA